MMLISAPDIISYSQSNVDEDTVLTQVRINTHERVFNFDMELSKFIPSFPPSLTMTCNPQMPSCATIVTNADVYSLSNVLKELAAVIYELKTLRTMVRLIPPAEIEERENNMGNLLSELLTFSDCSSKDLECGFGEFGRPTSYDDRNVLLTTIATSLLCEQSVAEEYICGPLTFLADIATRLYRSENLDLGFSTHLHFKNKEDKILFVQALLVSTVMDCGMYSCTNATEAWKKLHQDFYKFDENKVYDLRTEAALAYVSTPFTRIIMRRRIANKARVDRLPYWSVESNRKAVNRLDTSLLRSGNVLANSLALLAYTSNTSVYRIWRTEFNFDDLTNWLVEQQTANREFENAIDTYFGARSLYSYHLTQMPRGLHAGITGNISSANLSSVRQFDAKELPFSLSRGGDVPKRPTDIYPVTIRLSQSRNPGNLSHILQTVTIVLHSSMIKHLEIQHGLFTGFSTQATNVELLSGSAKLEPPKVSSTAVHFLLRDIEKEGAVTYAVTVIEPPTNYSPENLAPIAISAICHSVMGRLIVLPSSLSFGAISNMDDNSQDDDGIVALNVAQHPRHRRQMRHVGRQGLARTFVSSGPEAYRLDDENGEGAKQGNGMSVASNLQTISADLVETVCLPNGACICAEMTCSSLRCTNCSTLSFNSLCDELRQPTRFAIIFRITDSRSAKQEEAAYSVFDIKILDWYGDVVDAPDQMTIWLRNCNLQCISMTSSVDNSSSKPSAAPPKSMSSMAQVTTTKSMLRTHYVLRDSDRLAKSTDCWPLFGRPQSDDEEDQKRQADRDRKKAEVRKRLEEAGRMKKAKKGFLTPERKKKLRKLLMLKAAEDLKQQQMLKEQERQRILAERILPLPDLDSMSEAEWHKVGQEFVDRITELESASYDLSYKVRQKDFEINELSIAVNDLRGKFVKPTLKKVSKTDSQFDKIKKKGESKVDFRNNLKTVDKKQFVIEEKEEKTKVEWSKN
uniref:Uncharacterized protein n=1 Tax=Ditylenchus dipsaci TaxID=166011 RepID=A0A915EU93_9BILA